MHCHRGVSVCHRDGYVFPPTPPGRGSGHVPGDAATHARNVHKGGWEGVAGEGSCSMLQVGQKKTTHNHNVGTAFLRSAQRAVLGEPVSVGIFGDPVNDGLLLLGRNALVRVADTLEDVVDILGDTEHARPRLGHYMRVLLCDLATCRGGTLYSPYQVRSTPMRRANRTKA